jgi:Ca2+/Na+ antiporter
MPLLSRRKTKYGVLLILLLSIFSVFSLSVYAETRTESNYQLLAPIDTIKAADSSKGITLVDYMKGLFIAVIGLAIILAVVELVIGGIEYVAAAVPSSKEDAKKRIGGAVGGLLLILVAWILLQALNPKLLNVGLNLEKIAVVSGTSGPGRTAPPPPSYVADEEYVAGDNAVRRYLEAGGVQVKSNQCTRRGQSGCTSVFGLPGSAIEGLIALKASCGCEVFVSGGTEAGHVTHGVGNAIVDLRHNSSLDTYLKNVVCGKSGRNVYGNSGNYYWDEDPAHFHVTYGTSQC